VRRYLRCYGPSTEGHFAEWAGIAPVDARRSWQLVEPELVEVDLDDRKTRLNKRDVSHFTSVLTPSGVRLLPPHDPYLLQRDRETLLPDKTLHRRVWQVAATQASCSSTANLSAYGGHKRRANPSPHR